MIELRALGALDLTSADSNAASVVAQSRRAALLCYLALASPRGFHRRDTLFALFWPEDDAEHARHALRQSVYVLRRTLGSKTIVSRGDDELALAPEQVRCDVWAFDAAVDQGRPADALALYRGELLAGFHISAAPDFERWLDAERSRVRQRAAEAGWALAAAREREGNAAGAAAAARQAAALSPTDETALRRLILLLKRVGDQAAAVREYEAFAARLEREYELEPSAETQALVAMIRAESAESPATTPGHRSGLSPPARNSNIGIREAVAPSGPPGRRMRVFRGRSASIAVGILAAFAALFAVVRTVVRTPDSKELAGWANATAAAPAIAVLPFTVRGQGLEHWREGMVDLLSMGLDGAGGLRAIDSRTLLARWNEEIGDVTVTDLARALGVARRTEARYALVGSMVAAGPRVRLATDVYDLGSGRSVGQAQVEGSADSVLALIDRLGMQALGVILEKDPGDFHALDLAGVTTSSLAALKAYLEGEARFRRSELASAIAAWQRAVDVDTTFALAYFGLAEAYSWDETRDSAKSQEMLDRARHLAHRLPTREATLVRTKWAVRNAEPGYLAATEDAVRRYPDDAEAWYNLGEAYFHLAGAMRGPEETEHTFRRAVELQPGSALYRAHLVDLVFQWRPDSARIAREVEAYGRLAPQAARSRASRIAFAFGFGDSAARAEARAALDSVDRDAAALVYTFLTHPRFADAREAVFAALDPRLDERDWALMGFPRLRDLGLIDGQVRRALTLVDDPRAPAVVRYCGPFSLSADGLPVPEHILEARLALGSGDSSSFSSQAWLTCAAAHAAQRGRWRDHAAILSRARELAQRELAAGDSVSAREWHQVIGWAEAHELWRRGRKEEALRTFESVLTSDARAGWMLRDVGQLAFELGRLELAERAFQALWQWDGTPAYLYLGRIYERTGRIAQALDAYRFVNYAWRAADPELEPLVAEARQAVARLSGAEE